MSAVLESSVSLPPVEQLPLGPTIDKLFAIREKKRAADAESKKHEEEYEKLEAKLLAQLELDQTSMARGKKATASISESVVGNATSWPEFEAWARKKNFLHLFQRRLSNPGLIELWEKGVKIPGVEQFTKKRLNLRAL